MADLDIKSGDSSNNIVRFRSAGTTPLPPSAGKPVAVIGAAVHGTVNNATTNAPQIVFDNPGQ
jgi:hypothetical protein